jgi:endonuclease YncB( thermonuclease family)
MTKVDEVTVEEKRAQEQYERLAALLMTTTMTINYTQAIDIAKWLIREGYRVGWKLSIDPK